MCMHQSPAPIETYALAEYSKDIHGYNVTQSVHVEAVWPGDPVGETRWVRWRREYTNLDHKLMLTDFLQMARWNC